MMKEFQIPVPGGAVSAVLDEPTTPGGRKIVFVAAHGAGGSKQDRAMQTTAKTLTARGLHVIRHNFLYSERKSGRPDPIEKAAECSKAVADYVRAELAPDLLIIGGRSFGGRAGSLIAAEGYNADGLLLLAYPLHPAGNPAKLRDAHLPAITMPVLCFNGTRDELCTPEIMRDVLTRVEKNWTMHWVEGADHSFHVLKSSGRNDAAVQDEIGAGARAWVDSI
jgi:predicted alpha/beta-hydrolase family hydrolase